MEFPIFDVSYRFLIKVAGHVQSTKKKRKFVKFQQYIKKRIATAFVFYCDGKHSDTLLGPSHVCRYLFLGGCGQKWHGTLKSVVSQESELIK